MSWQVNWIANMAGLTGCCILSPCTNLRSKCLAVYTSCRLERSILVLKISLIERVSSVGACYLLGHAVSVRIRMMSPTKISCVNEVCGTKWSNLIGRHTPAVSSPGLGTEWCHVQVVVVARRKTVYPGGAWNGSWQPSCWWGNIQLQHFLFQSRPSNKNVKRVMDHKQAGRRLGVTHPGTASTTTLARWTTRDPPTLSFNSTLLSCSRELV